MSHIRKPIPSALLALIAFAVSFSALLAHGTGRPRMLNEPAGPYLLSAWTDPDPLREDEAHVVVAVIDPATQEPIVTGVEVEVRAAPVASPDQAVSVSAGTDSVNQLLYAAEFNDMLSAGAWLVTIHVRGERGTGESAGFEIEIEPARGFNWLLVGAGGIGVIVLVWLAGSLRSERPERARRRKPAAGA